MFIDRRSPRNDWSIEQDRSKFGLCCLNLVHILELVLHLGAVTTKIWIAPGNYWAICQDRSKCGICRSNLLHAPELISTSELSPPSCGLPHVTTDPSDRIAANAECPPWICRTLLSWCWTRELSPPLSGRPQVTTEPSSRIARIAANANHAAGTCFTLLSWSWISELPPPSSG